LNVLHEQLARASAWLWPSLLNHAWQAALFAAAVLGLTLLLRGGPARLRFTLWLAAAAKLAVPSALFTPLAAWLGAGAAAASGAGAGAGAGVAAPLFLRIAEPVAAAPADPAASGASAAAAGGHGELLCALTLAWAAGCAALLCVWLRRRREVARAVRGGREVWSGREFEAAARGRARLGLRREVLVVLSDAGAEPGVWRTRRPVLLLPSGVAAQLDEDELEAVVLHELAHVERRDNLVANLQTALACLFWFNPVVWLVGRRLFAERERACDERVIEAGGASAAYASGILKVVRFCSGWRVAGVAGVASGSNLRRRVEMIMRGEMRAGVRAWQRALAACAWAAALALTVCAGLYAGAREAEARMLEGDGAGQTRDGARIITRGGRGARGGGVERRGQEPGPAVREVEQAAEAMVYFEPAAGAPAVVTEARMRMITREQLRRAYEEGADSFGDEDSPLFLTLPTVTVANTSARTIREVGVGFETNGRLGVITGHAVKMNPGESQTFRSSWFGRNVIIPGSFADLKVRVVWVAFEDGTQWGARARPPRPPAPPAPDPAAPPLPPGEDEPAGGLTDRARASGRGSEEAGSGVGSGVGVSSGVGSVGVGSVGGGSGSGSGSGSGVVNASGGGGVGLSERRLYAPKPSYPAIAKAAGAGGTVTVRVTVDEEGNVVAAEAVSGHPLLHAAAVDAARRSKFKPTFLRGRPVKVAGVISYVFAVE
jgi:TonB family protein